MALSGHLTAFNTLRSKNDKFHLMSKKDDFELSYILLYFSLLVFELVSNSKNYFGLEEHLKSFQTSMM